MGVWWWISTQEDVQVTASYFRDLADRCRKAARDCFDLYAKEEFRRLAHEFTSKAEELEFASRHDGLSGWWRRPDQPAPMGRDR
jgi:hypothetical protein